MRARIHWSGLVLLVIALGGCAVPEADRPRLLVTVVVDGLSTDQLLRHRDCLKAGGFERLFAEGAWFPRSRLSHTTTFTAPGFATVATGSSPSEHGMVGNSWFDREAGQSQYCVGDAAARLLGASRSEGESASPVHLLRPALADVLHERLSGRSRSLGLSIKDRGAVLGAGRKGSAYWYDSRSGRFVTSTFFTDALPDWWESYYATRPLEPYLGRERDPRSCPRAWHEEHARALEELPVGDPRREISPRLPNEAGTAFYSTLRDSPWGDRATLHFLERARAELQLGESPDRIDQLLIGFSCTDYVGHDRGPDSALATAVLAGLDQTLADLFDLLDREVGVGEWTLALTADHGYPPAPELAALRGGGGGRLDPREIGDRLDIHLDEVFAPADWVRGWNVPTYTLSREAAREHGVDFSAVQEEARSALLEIEGIFEVVSRSQLESETYDGPFAEGVRRAFHPARSGDLLVLQDRNWYLLYDPRSNVATHGSPWEYDREVPLFFLGRGVRAGEYESLAEVRDLAPTLLSLAGLEPAASMSGTALTAALLP